MFLDRPKVAASGDGSCLIYLSACLITETDPNERPSRVHHTACDDNQIDKAPACMVGPNSERGFDHLPLTVDEEAVTYRRRRKALGIDAK